MPLHRQSPAIIAYFIALINITSSLYWLSQNRLSWADASTYCQSRCGSNLVSIHDINDYLDAKYVINNSSVITAGFTTVESNVWIGLNKLDGSWGWSDTSPFDYDDTITGGVFPWGFGEPSDPATDECAQYFTDNLWNDGDCVSKRRNSCEGVLDKYILYQTSGPYSTASDFCENTLI